MSEISSIQSPTIHNPPVQNPAIQNPAVHPADAAPARRRLLDTAERLFMQRGYSAIALRDLAQALNIKQASLYYHFPGGKEELYVAVAERAFARHRDGMQAALAGCEARGIQAQLEAAAAWFAGQPSMCLMGMVHADLPALHTAGADRVAQAATHGLIEPLVRAFALAQARGELQPRSPHLLAGAFLALLDGITIAQTIPNTGERAAIVSAMIDLLLNGARATAPAAPSLPAHTHTAPTEEEPWHEA